MAFSPGKVALADVIGCSSRAIEMVPVSAEECFIVRSSVVEWEEMRLQYLAAEKQRGGSEAPAKN